MSQPYAFWDTSALVSLCTVQLHTAEALGMLDKYRLVIWWATPVEITSALTRLLRSGDIDATVYAQAQRQSEGYANLWSVVAPSAQIALDARILLERYPLRAADALQLAAALAWCGEKPKGKAFLTFDKKLREVASQAGFTLE